MRQRLGLAAALLGDPVVLLLDEPANGLDPHGIRWLRRSCVVRGPGKAVLVSSHLLYEMPLMADDVIVIDRGRLLRQGSLEELTNGGATNLEDLFLDLTDGKGYPMNDVLRSEFRKFRTTRTAFGLLAGAVALTGLALWGSLSGATPAELAAGLTSPFGYAGVVVIIMLFVMVLGIRSFTDEVRYGSVVPTFLATPKRLRVLAAKTAVSAAAAVVFAVVALGVGTGVIAVYLVAHGYAVPVAAWSLAGLFGRAIAIAVLWATIGVSVGVVVRHQVAAIVGALAWLFVVENILGSILPRSLPGYRPRPPERRRASTARTR